MIASNPVCSMNEYGTSSQYKREPEEEQRRCGVVPLDSLPAEWWNYYWNCMTVNNNSVVRAFDQVIAEINTVLCCNGITVSCLCTDQLYTAIEYMRRTLATSTIAGSVVSSTDNGKVSVAADGTMTANGLGNVATLTTINKNNVVTAINELKSTYDTCFGNVATCTSNLASSISSVNTSLTNAINTTNTNLTNLGTALGNGTCTVAKATSSTNSTYTGTICDSSHSWTATSIYNWFKCCNCTSYVCRAARTDTVVSTTGSVMCFNSTGICQDAAWLWGWGTGSTGCKQELYLACCIKVGCSLAVTDVGCTTSPLYIGYVGDGLTSAQFTNFAAFSQNCYCTGKTVIKNISKDTVASILSNKLAAISCACGYWGLVPPDNTYIRTPANGLLPVCSCSTSGISYLGTSTWPFKELYVKCINGSALGTAAYCAATSFLSSATTCVACAGKLYDSSHSWTATEVYNYLKCGSAYSTCVCCAVYATSATCAMRSAGLTTLNTMKCTTGSCTCGGWCLGICNTGASGSCVSNLYICGCSASANTEGGLYRTENVCCTGTTSIGFLPSCGKSCVVACTCCSCCNCLKCILIGIFPIL